MDLLDRVAVEHVIIAAGMVRYFEFVQLLPRQEVARLEQGHRIRDAPPMSCETQLRAHSSHFLLLTVQLYHVVAERSYFAAD